MKRIAVITVLLTGLLTGLLCGCGSRHGRPSISEWDSVIAAEEARNREGVPAYSNTKPAPAQPAAGVYSRPVGDYREVFNDSNSLQYQSAERLGISPIHSLGMAYRTRRPLVKIESGEFYTVDSLTHSMPFLVPEAAALLAEIGKEFGDKVEERGGSRSNKILVTSMLRSPYSVRRLRRVNRNAVDSSTHMFATTFDISWYRFDCPDSTKAVNAETLKGILAEVLAAKRSEGKCYVKYERKSPCFHITAR